MHDGKREAVWPIRSAFHDYPFASHMDVSIVIARDVFHLLHVFFDFMRSLRICQFIPYRSNTDRVKASTPTFGSKLSAVVKCLIAFPFCLKALYTRPSMK